MHVMSEKTAAPDALKVLTAIASHAAVMPNKAALHLLRDGEWSTISYAGLLAETEAWARYFLSLGLPANSVVFFVLRHRREAYPAFLGAMRAGLIPSFLPFPTPKQDHETYWKGHAVLLDRIKPSAIVSYGDNVALLAALVSQLSCAVLDIEEILPLPILTTLLPSLDEVEGDKATALLQHSSGTTGLKKGVMLDFEQIRLQIKAFSTSSCIDERSVIVSWLPIYHDMGLIACFLLPFTMGATITAIDPFDWLKRPDMLLTLIEEYGGTHCWLPNFAYNHLVRTRNRNRTYDLSSMVAFLSGSEPAKPETMDRFREIFTAQGLRSGVLQVAYGMAETVLGVSQTKVGRDPKCVYLELRPLVEARKVVQVAPQDKTAKVAFLSCGLPLKDVSFQIDSPEGEDVGEVLLRAPFMFSGYYLNEEATRQAFRDGWYATGDSGFILDGELYICGRLKEILIVHGRNYYATDIENIVSAIPGVKPGRAVCFGLYDAGSASEEAVLLAESEIEDPEMLEKLRQSIRETVFNRLELTVRKIEILPLSQIVKTTSGKISREDNRTRYLERLNQGA